MMLDRGAETGAGGVQTVVTSRHRPIEFSLRALAGLLVQMTTELMMQLLLSDIIINPDIIFLCIYIRTRINANKTKREGIVDIAEDVYESSSAKECVHMYKDEIIRIVGTV